MRQSSAWRFVSTDPSLSTCGACGQKSFEEGWLVLEEEVKGGGGGLHSYSSTNGGFFVSTTLGESDVYSPASETTCEMLS